MLLETGSSLTQVTTSIAGGIGDYAWRVRGIGNLGEGGIANPQNWGEWSDVGFKTFVAPTGATKWTTDLNWIYSRNFSEGGREKEQLTFANGLLHTRQSQTKLHLASGTQIIGLQTLQDYVGRDALQSLPIPLPNGLPMSDNASLGFRKQLLTVGTNANGTSAYGPAQFDAPLTITAPAQATELGQYYSGSTPANATYPNNDGVASAEAYPFTRTLFSRDGTNRVREQASAGATLGLAAASGVKRTIRTSYGSVSQAELTRLFGVAESPLAKDSYQIVTTDANNSATVTYQTKAGQTIATALVGRSGENNLQALNTAPAVGGGFTVTDHVNDRVAYGTTGSTSSKLLVVPPGGLTLTLDYKITPQSILDACGQCSTCDYQVEIRIRNVDDPNDPDNKEAFPFKAALTNCGVPVNPPANIPNATLHEGTWLIEKRIVSYTSPARASLNDPAPATYLDSKTAALQASYEAFKTGQTAIQPGTVSWKTINSYLGDPSNISKTKVADLYTKLSGYPQQTVDGVPCYVLSFGCSGNSTPIYLPILDTNCGPAPTCGPNYPRTGFEHCLRDSLQIPSGSISGTTVYTYFPDLGQPGQIEAMVGGILNDPLYSTQCAKVWGCWRGVIETFNVTTEYQLNNGTATPNLQQQFLQCFGAPLKNIIDGPGPVNPAQLYNTVFINTSNNPAHFNCLKFATLRAGLDATLSAQDQIIKLIQRQADDQQNHPDNPEAYDYIQDVYGCINSDTNGPLPAGVSAQDLSQQQVAAIQQNGAQQCENRRLEFRQTILKDFRRQQIYTYLDQYALVYSDELHTYVPNNEPLPVDADQVVGACEVDLMVEELVASCKDYTHVTAAYSTTTHKIEFSQDDIDRLKAAMLYKMEVQVREVGQPCGPPTTMPLAPDFKPSILIQGGALQSVQLTSCAEDLTSYLNALIRTANGIPGFGTGNGHTLLGCPPSNRGVGELTIDNLSYVGPLDVDCNRIFAADASSFKPNRQHYWITIQDNRNDSGLNTWEPSVYSPPAPAPNLNFFNTNNFQHSNGSIPAYVRNYDFRLVWGYRDLPSTIAPNITNFPYLCYANGDDTPGVPKLLEPKVSENATFDYIIRLLRKDNGNPIDKGTILTLSAPFIDSQAGQVAGFDDPFSTATVGVTVFLKNGQSVSATIQLQKANSDYAPPTSNADAYLKQFLMWKNVERCEIPNRRYTTCFRFVEPILEVAENDHPYNPVAPDCQTVLAASLAESIERQQNAWIQESLRLFRQHYAEKCVAPEKVDDDLTISYTLGYHHYTLYYYDRAGNLIKTVPPAGVMPVDPYAVGTMPAPPQPQTLQFPVPQHRLVTTYQYNSLKQLVRQTTPDGGTTDFVYNRIGQLRFSINDKQEATTPLQYSYTKYDELGRPIETGETAYGVPVAAPGKSVRQTLLERFDAIESEEPTFPFQYAGHVQTQTIYNVAYGTVTYPYGANQGQTPRYLTNRVAYAESFNNPSSSVADVRTHYSYDPHGNVEWLAQELPGLGIKYTRYEYDLISNKVLLVAYQEGQPDQFLHRYEYDDENRLLAVATSVDGVDWDQDATYTYYTHGPLRRTVLGQDQVQGLDYTYTLQGWLKSINQPDLNGTNDPGKDASGSTPSGAGVDAFGMVLNYFQGDYKHSQAFPDASQTNSPIFQPTTTTGTSTIDQNLYNGNIATWQSNNRQDVPSSGVAAITTPTNELYRYDQLNRILSSRQYTLTGSTRTEQTSYATDYSYDANGNLQTLKRRGGDSDGLFDDLVYSYLEQNGTAGNLTSNRLSYVHDKVGATTALADDIEDQVPFNAGANNNYSYDELGNLTRDAQSGVTAITWTLAGKIRSVRKDNPAYPGDANKATFINYRYDASGNRISKDVLVASTGNQQHTYYVRDAQGNIMGVYDQPETNGQLQDVVLREQPIYGSNRLGERKPNLVMPILGSASVLTAYYTRTIGLKSYELNDHLSNVRAVVTDQKLSTLVAGTLAVQPNSFRPSLSGYYNYYPFGMMQPGRYGPGNSTTSTVGNRFGYDSMEKEESYSSGIYTTEFRFLDTRIARWMSIDPETAVLPNSSPYTSMSNNPITRTDVKGNKDIYRIHSNGEIEVTRNNDKTNTYIYESGTGALTNLGEYPVTSNGMVAVPANDWEYQRVLLSQAKYLPEDGFAAFLGATYSYYTQTLYKTKINQLMTLNKLHSPNNPNQKNPGKPSMKTLIDAQYIGLLGTSYSTQADTRNSNVDDVASNDFANIVRKFGFNDEGKWNVITLNGQGNGPELPNSAFTKPHQNHIHFQSTIKANEVLGLQIPSPTQAFRSQHPELYRQRLE